MRQLIYFIMKKKGSGAGIFFVIIQHNKTFHIYCDLNYVLLSFSYLLYYFTITSGDKVYGEKNVHFTDSTAYGWFCG